MSAVRIWAHYLVILTSLCLLSDSVVHCFDYDELEIFDLVEEINANFYDVLGIEQV